MKFNSMHRTAMQKSKLMIFNLKSLNKNEYNFNFKLLTLKCYKIMSRLIQIFLTIKYQL